MIVMIAWRCSAPFGTALWLLPHGVTPLGAVQVAGAAGKLHMLVIRNSAGAIATTSGVESFGGMFLALAYFGCDQSQVQRYLTRQIVEGQPHEPAVQRQWRRFRCKCSSCSSARWCFPFTISPSRRWSSNRPRCERDASRSRSTQQRRAALRRRLSSERKAAATLSGAGTAPEATRSAASTSISAR